MDRARLQDAMDDTRAAHTRLTTTLRGLQDDDAYEPSLLPGWTRAHVLTHLARNAESHVRLLTAAARGERVEQYAGGSGGRASAIEAGVGRPPDELIVDVESSAQRLFSVWDEVPERVWDEEVIAIHGGQPAWACVFSRWRETEIHHVDLDLGYTSADWPLTFVSATLPPLVDSIDKRLPAGVAVEVTAPDIEFSAVVGANAAGAVRLSGNGAALVAWLTGRPYDVNMLRVHDGDLPDIGPWI